MGRQHGRALAFLARAPATVVVVACGYGTALTPDGAPPLRTDAGRRGAAAFARVTAHLTGPKGLRRRARDCTPHHAGPRRARDQPVTVNWPMAPIAASAIAWETNG